MHSSLSAASYHPKKHRNSVAAGINSKLSIQPQLYHRRKESSIVPGSHGILSHQSLSTSTKNDQHHQHHHHQHHNHQQQQQQNHRSTNNNYSIFQQQQQQQQQRQGKNCSIFNSTKFNKEFLDCRSGSKSFISSSSYNTIAHKLPNPKQLLTHELHQHSYNNEHDSGKWKTENSPNNSLDENQNILFKTDATSRRMSLLRIMNHRNHLSAQDNLLYNDVTMEKGNKNHSFLSPDDSNGIIRSSSHGRASTSSLFQNYQTIDIRMDDAQSNRKSLTAATSPLGKNTLCPPQWKNGRICSNDDLLNKKKVESRRERFIRRISQIFNTSSDGRCESADIFDVESNENHSPHPQSLKKIGKNSKKNSNQFINPKLLHTSLNHLLPHSFDEQQSFAQRTKEQKFHENSSQRHLLYTDDSSLTIDVHQPMRNSLSSTAASAISKELTDKNLILINNQGSTELIDQQNIKHLSKPSLVGEMVRKEEEKSQSKARSSLPLSLYHKISPMIDNRTTINQRMPSIVLNQDSQDIETKDTCELIDGHHTKKESDQQHLRIKNLLYYDQRNSMSDADRYQLSNIDDNDDIPIVIINHRESNSNLNKKNDDDDDDNNDDNDDGNEEDKINEIIEKNERILNESIKINSNISIQQKEDKLNGSSKNIMDDNREKTEKMRRNLHKFLETERSTGMDRLTMMSQTLFGHNSQYIHSNHDKTTCSTNDVNDVTNGCLLIPMKKLMRDGTSKELYRFSLQEDGRMKVHQPERRMEKTSPFYIYCSAPNLNEYEYPFANIRKVDNLSTKSTNSLCERHRRQRDDDTIEQRRMENGDELKNELSNKKRRKKKKKKKKRNDLESRYLPDKLILLNEIRKKENNNNNNNNKKKKKKCERRRNDMICENDEMINNSNLVKKKNNNNNNNINLTLSHLKEENINNISNSKNYPDKTEKDEEGKKLMNLKQQQNLQDRELFFSSISKANDRLMSYDNYCSSFNPSKNRFYFNQLKDENSYWKSFHEKHPIVSPNDFYRRFINQTMHHNKTDPSSLFNQLPCTIDKFDYDIQEDIIENFKETLVYFYLKKQREEHEEQQRRLFIYQQQQQQQQQQQRLKDEQTIMMKNKMIGKDESTDDDKLRKKKDRFVRLTNEEYYQLHLEHHQRYLVMLKRQQELLKEIDKHQSKKALNISINSKLHSFFTSFSNGKKGKILRRSSSPPLWKRDNSNRSSQRSQTTKSIKDRKEHRRLEQRTRMRISSLVTIEDEEENEEDFDKLRSNLDGGKCLVSKLKTKQYKKSKKLIIEEHLHKLFNRTKLISENERISPEIETETEIRHSLHNSNHSNQIHDETETNISLKKEENKKKKKQTESPDKTSSNNYSNINYIDDGDGDDNEIDGDDEEKKENEIDENEKEENEDNLIDNNNNNNKMMNEKKSSFVGERNTKNYFHSSPSFINSLCRCLRPPRCYGDRYLSILCLIFIILVTLITL